MRLKCEYSTDKFPLAYQMLVVSLIKEALMRSDEEYFSKIYNYKEGKTNKATKNFCFSVFIKDYKKEVNIFTIYDRVIINISSGDYEFMIKLYNGLLKIKGFEYKGFIINRIGIDLVKEKEINKDNVEFTTLSPIYIKDKNNNSLDFNDKKFVKELNYIVDKTLENFRGYGLKKELRFKPLYMKKRVVKEEIRKFTQNTNKSFYYVNSCVGRFVLEGDMIDLRDIYALGLGFRRNQGFGMIEVVG
ncbi:CRISPR associated protein Cas6 [Clostridium tepidiprofundi DSM 19306]|uniref:CRISPR associated protein Cas6 n=1 Tax=Clostridium tepidiprofundi DSM 19306 TaxID=1121338 RepID=A0A151B2V2_9CLOT|nr:CRISPR-associated endoribonuclease Cas6 [Clostridium tepidiprofundi]KYH34082.1 CRISPR associated protein Cas6 [Clostridium tepidiprofundi DSM 19306]